MQQVSSFSETENFKKYLFTYFRIFVKLSGLNEKFSLQMHASIDMYVMYALHVTSMLLKKALHIHIMLFFCISKAKTII